MNASKLDDDEVLDALKPLELEVVDEDETFYISVGEVVAEKYRVEGVLGAGGMGVVLSAKHVELGERFALKFLNEEFLREDVVIQRFTQEARAACRIKNEHVARVYDVGSHRGAPFLVMEHLEGRDLATIVAKTGALAIEDAVEYTMQACEALADAHRQGIIHRDIKPENLFLVEVDGLPRVKVLDFGISKTSLTSGDAPSRLTGQLTLGTPCYMSPEQIRSTATADASSDLWSLGVVLYELLAGVEAFRAATVTGVCAAVLEEEPEPLSSLRPELPPGLAEVIARCLAKNPAARFANVAEFALALLPFAPPRALVSVERATSLIRGTRVDTGRERHVTSIRPHKISGASRAISLAIEPGPSSNAPLWRDVPEAAAARRGRRKYAYLALAACAVAGVAGLAFTASRKAEVPQAVAAVAPLPEVTTIPSSPGAAAAPVAVRVTSSSERAVDDTARAAAGAVRRATPTAPVRARASASAPEATPSSTASSTASSTHAASAAPSSRTVPSAAAPALPTGSPSVELGY